MDKFRLYGRRVRPRRSTRRYTREKKSKEEAKRTRTYLNAGGEDNGGNHQTLPDAECACRSQRQIGRESGGREDVEASGDRSGTIRDERGSERADAVDLQLHRRPCTWCV